MSNKKTEELILTTNYKKKEGLLYILDRDGDLSECVMCGIIGRDKDGKPIYQKEKKVLKIGIKRDKGFLYFIKGNNNKACEVWRVAIT